MARSRIELFFLIAFTLVASLNCQENNISSQEPLINSNSTDSGTGGSIAAIQGDSQQIAGQAVKDGLLTDQGAAAGNDSVSSTASPSVKSLTTLVQHLPDGENAFFTDTGRLFVTDGISISEITDRGTVNKLFTDTSGLLGGIAQAGKWLYVLHATVKKPLPAIDLCSLFTSGNILTLLIALTDTLMDKELLRADISGAGTPVFTSIYTFQDVLLPNGMAADADGNLYVADQTFLPGGGIIKLTISADDRPIVRQETWLSAKNGASSPNGVVISGNTLYFTDFVITSTKPAKVKKVDIINGRPGTVTIVYSALSFFDDLDIGAYGNRTYIAVSDYLLNSIILISENDGTKTRLGTGKIANPSSVHFGTAPQFRSNELIITEKGLLYELYSSYGNKLTCLTLPE